LAKVGAENLLELCLLGMQLVPSPDGSLQVISGISADGIALESEVAFEAKLVIELPKLVQSFR